MSLYQLIQNYIFQRIFIVFIAFGLYANTIGHGFVLDDVIVVTENDYVLRGFQGIQQIFFHDSYQAFLEKHKEVRLGSGHYRPLSLATFAIEYQLFGLNPQVMHLNNVIIYALTSLLLLITLQRMFRGFDSEDKNLLPFVAALLWVCHPIHTDVVANIKERDELLSFFFILCSVYFVLLGVHRTLLIKLLLLPWVVGSFLFALLSKETAIVLVLIIPLVLYCFTTVRKIEFLLLAIPFWVTLIFFLQIQQFFSIESDKSMMNVMTDPLVGATLQQKISTIIFVMGKYLQLLIFPHPLSHDYSYNQISIKEWHDWEVIASVLVFLISSGVAIFRLKKRQSRMSFGFLYFTCTLGLITFMMDALFPTGSLLSERFLYAPSLGFCIGFTFMLHNILEYFFSENIKQNRRLVVYLEIFIFLVCSLYSIKTILRNQVWKSNFTLFSNDVKNSPKSVRVLYKLGNEYILKAEQENDKASKDTFYNKALEQLEKAVKIYPDFDRAWVAIGRTRLHLKEYDKAKDCYQKALNLDKTCLEAYEHIGKLDILHGNYQEAKSNIEKWVILIGKTRESKHRKALAMLTLANVYSELGNFDFAVPTYRAAIQKDSTLSEAYMGLGLALENKKGSISLAIQNLKKALSLKPNNMTALHHLGKAYVRKGDYENGLDNLTKAFNIEPKNEQLLRDISQAYYEKGDTAMSRAFQEKADLLRE